MRSARRCALLALVPLLVALVAGCGGDGSDDGGSSTEPSSAAASSGSRVVMIVLENHGFHQVVGNPEVPFFNSLVARGTLATNYHAIRHPSLPNYLALLGGSTFGIGSDCTDCMLKARSNLATQLSEAGISWRAYMESMPGPCSPVAEAGLYAKKHDPFMYFPSIAEDPNECRNVVPATQLEVDHDAGRLPSFVWLTPNLCHDAHDCSLASADEYLRDVVPPLLKDLGPEGFLVVDFDEDEGEQESAYENRGENESSTDGGRIPVVLVGPTVRQGAQASAPYDHYSMLRTLEEVFGLSPLRNAASAQPMRAAFTRFPRIE